MNAASILLAVAAVGVNLGNGAVILAGDGPTTHTTRYQYQNSPPPSRSASPPVGSSAYDRYGTSPSGNATGVGPPPGVAERAQAAAIDTGNSLRQGFESGFQQTNDEALRVGNRVLDGARDVGQGVGNQMQDFANSTGRQLQYTGDNIRNTAEQTYGVAADGIRQTGEALGVTGSSPPPGVNSAASRATAVGQNGAAPPPLSPFATTNQQGWSSTSGPPATTGGFSSTQSPAPASGGSVLNSAPNGARSPGVTQTTTGWSSFDRDTPAPPLATPSLAPPDANLPVAARSVGGLSAGAQTAGPTFSNSPPSGATIHDPLVDPGTRGGSLGSFPATSTQNPTNVWNLPAANDPFNRGPVIGDPGSSTAGNRSMPPPGVNSPGQGGFSNFPPTTTGGANSGWALPANTQTGSTTLPANSLANQPGQVQLNPAGGANSGFGGTSTQNANSNAAPPRGKSDANDTAIAADKPWMPLVFVSLTLIGSLSANFFLGWSYVDARQKYQTLVRKTADKFRRAAEAA